MGSPGLMDIYNRLTPEQWLEFIFLFPLVVWFFWEWIVADMLGVNYFKFFFGVHGLRFISKRADRAARKKKS